MERAVKVHWTQMVLQFLLNFIEIYLFSLKFVFLYHNEKMIKEYIMLWLDRLGCRGYHM